MSFALPTPLAPGEPYRFCPACATPLEARPRGGRLRPTCPACGFVQFRNPVVGVAVLVVSAGRVLLGRRCGAYAGDWCVPCGYVEWDEDLRRAAQREFLEETGLEVCVNRPYDVQSNFHNVAQHSVGVWFLGRVTGGTLVAGDDLDRVAYFDLDALPENLCFPTDRVVLARLQADYAAGRLPD